MLNVSATMEALLEQEDVDRDGLITVDDDGPKVECGHPVEGGDFADRFSCSPLLQTH